MAIEITVQDTAVKMTDAKKPLSGKFRKIKIKKILLIGPNKDSVLRKGQYLAPPMGLYRIKFFVEALTQCSVDVVDPILKTKEYIRSLIKKNSYDIIGFSMLQQTIPHDIPLIFEAKEISSGSLIIAGGQGAVFNHQTILKDTPVDVIVRGFGEFTILNMTQMPEKLDEVKGLYISHKDKIIDTGRTKPITHRQFREISLLFRFNQVPYEEYWELMQKIYTVDHLKIMKNEHLDQTIRIMTSTHCVKKCVFCSSTNFLNNCSGQQKRIGLDGADMFSLVAKAKESHPGCNAIFFNDDDFLVDKDRIKKLCHLLQEIPDMSYLCLSRIDNIDDDLLKLLKKTNFRLIIYGVESFSKNILEHMQKRIIADEPGTLIADVVKMTIDNDIAALMNIILFFPTTRLDDIIRTIECCVALVEYGARLTVYPYLEAYRGASIMDDKSLTIVNKTFTAAKKRFKIPNLVLPRSKAIKKLAASAIIMQQQIIRTLLIKYRWSGVVPHPVYGLALFLAVYRLIDKDTTRIENLIDRIMGNEPELRLESGRSRHFAAKNARTDVLEQSFSIATKARHSEQFPNIVNVCVIRGICPCECFHCPVGSTPKHIRKRKFGRSSMDIGVFKSIADEIAGFRTPVLRIHGVGEPIIWNNFREAIIYSKLKRARTWLFTSLVTKDSSLLRLIAENCSIVEVSVNSIDSEDYRMTKGIDCFKLVLKNIKTLSSIIKKGNLQTRLIVSRVEGLNSDYDKLFVDHWKKSGLVADAFVRSYHTYNDAIAERKKKKSRANVPCLVHWTRFNIDVDGNAVVCFNELFKGPVVPKELVLGNLYKNSIWEIWHGQKLDNIRQSQLMCEKLGDSMKKDLPCITCSHCQPLNTRRPTSEDQVRRHFG